jgi:hypothetical protein
MIMSTLYLKLKVFDKLKSIKNIRLLKKTIGFLKTVKQNELYYLSEYELDILEEGEEYIINKKGASSLKLLFHTRN